MGLTCFLERKHLRMYRRVASMTGEWIVFVIQCATEQAHINDRIERVACFVNLTENSEAVPSGCQLCSLIFPIRSQDSCDCSQSTDATSRSLVLSK